MLMHCKSLESMKPREDIQALANEEIAKIMNEYFVNIKVDREEYPDVDAVSVSYTHLTLPTKRIV